MIEIYQSISITDLPETKVPVPKLKVLADSNILPFVVLNKEDPLCLRSDDQSITYDINTRNYLKSFPVSISSVKQLRYKPDGEDASTIEIKFILQENQSYKTAANLAVYPKNDANLVEAFATHFKLDLNQCFKLGRN